MKKYVAMLFCLAAALVVAVLYSQSAQPRYAAKPLSYWLRKLSQGIQPSNQAVTAIRAIGTNGIPIYLRILHAKGTPLTAWIHFRGDGSAVVERRLVVDPVWSIKEEFSGILGWAVLQPLGRRDANALRDDGLSAFYILGETGAPAVPGLSNLLFASDGYRWPVTDPVFRSMHTSECLNWLRQLDAAYCLGHIGTAGRAALLQGLESSDTGIRSAAAHGLGLCRTYDPVIVGALVRHLDDANTSVRITVAWSLSLAAARFGGGTNATSVSAISPMVAPLMRCLSATELYLRSYAAVALGNCHSAEALPLVANLVSNGNVGSGTLEAMTRQALENITAHPVSYGVQPLKVPANP
jgi:hypothetical protein